VAPGRDRRSGKQLREDFRMRPGIAQRRRDDVGGQQRPWRGAAAELVGDDRQVDKPVLADAAAARLLAH
jgi:hypothetical protein